MNCNECGHPLKYSKEYRTTLDWIRRRPQYWRCEAVDEDDIGNGMAGSGPCGCTHPSHTFS
jgi:hypothetical protein